MPKVKLLKMNSNCMNLHLCTFNVNGLCMRDKLRAIYQKLRDSLYDIIFIQETHCTVDIQHIWKSEWRGDAIFANGTSNSRGVAILFSKNLQH